MTFTFAEEPEPPKDEAPKPKPAPAPAAPAAAPAPAAAASVPAPRPAPAPVPAAAEPDDPELKPGSRKDLWTCPHCGAGNKPDRSTCRACGKSPADPVLRPWNRNPVVLGGIAAAVVGAIAVLWLATRPDLSYRDPGAAGIDAAPRISGGPSAASRDLPGGRVFEAAGRISVSGRVLASRPFAGGGTSVALALGSDAADDAAFAALKASAGAAGFELPAGAVVLHLVGSKERPARGTWLSVAGDRGVVTEQGRIVGGDGDAVIPDPDRLGLVAP
ncbi:MAG: hypothetical protein RLZZ127_736 [Planctomycetota bacterium]|jgi:hypothetical protein